MATETRLTEARAFVREFKWPGWDGYQASVDCACGTMRMAWGRTRADAVNQLDQEGYCMEPPLCPNCCRAAMRTEQEPPV